ncbi:MAG: hypothetical protein HUJ71_07025 [Pseudobutyrivibrio sp.]|nr:hypothetical protein [Pseudobutyrivibrio sp.]
MDVTGMSSYLDSMYSNTASSANAADAKKNAGKITSESTKEELTEAVKGFEQYFVEQVIKQFKESVDNMKEDSESNISMYSDYFMDATISQLAEELIGDQGAGITEDFVESIMRTYHISETKTEDWEDVSDDQSETSDNEIEEL